VDHAGWLGRRDACGEPRAGLVNLGELTCLVPGELTEPAWHLSLEIAVRSPEPFKSSRTPIEAVESGERVDQREPAVRRRVRPGGQLGRERFAHHDSVDDIHEIKRGADHLDIGTTRDRHRNRHRLATVPAPRIAQGPQHTEFAGHIVRGW